MPSITNDRSKGVQSTLAVKAPVRLHASANITLSGHQLVDGVMTVDGSRVLVSGQADNTTNGIYTADSGSWQRAPDFDGDGDVTTGTQFKIVEGTTYGGHWYELTSANPVVFGTSAITFSEVVNVTIASDTEYAGGAGLSADNVEDAIDELAGISALKVDKTSSTGSAVIPSRTTAERDVADPTPTAGLFGFNETTGKFEGGDGTDWVVLLDSTTALVDVTSDNTWSGAQRGTVTTDNDLSFDQNVSNNFKSTPTGTGTLTFTNHTAGQSGYVLLDNSGGYAISAAPTTKVSSSFLSNVSVAGVYLISYLSDGTNTYCTASGALA